jgi:mRNA interferase RelE/StbE
MTKVVIFLAPARKALLRHRTEAERIIAKIEAYAADPAALANKVKTLKGHRGKRLRVGEFRVIFEETAMEIIVTGIGPRGSVYN